MTDSVVDLSRLDVVLQDFREGVLVVALAEGTLEVEVFSDRHGGVEIAQSLLVGMSLDLVQPGGTIGQWLFGRGGFGIVHFVGTGRFVRLIDGGRLGVDLGMGGRRG